MSHRIWAARLMVPAFLDKITEVAAILGVAIAVNSLQDILSNVNASSHP